MIILLNGATSSGKSSIAKAIQHLSDMPWLIFGIDTVIHMLPAKYRFQGEKAEEGFNFTYEKDQEGTLMCLKIGEYAQQIYFSIAEIAALLDKKGLNVIIDEVLLDDASLKNYANLLSAAKVYFVGVHCDKKIIEEREVLRGDRFIGSARDQMNRCHGTTRQYDIEIDTSFKSSFDCAKQILNFIATEQFPKKLCYPAK